MKSASGFIVFNNIKLQVNASVTEAFSVARAKMRRLGLSGGSCEYRVWRRSIDARNKNDIKLVYSIAAIGEYTPPSAEALGALGATVATENNAPLCVIGENRLSDRPVIVGSGPAGMFAGLILAERGYKPIVLERGGSVFERKISVEEFCRTKKLSESTNIQFGAGGAGTFSDGKLVTRINDPLTSYVIDRLCEFGAPGEIKYIAKPHIGTDILSSVVENILHRICELGGEVHYNTRYITHKSSCGRIRSVVTDKGEIPAGALILAIGHSSRDTYKTLIEADMEIVPKDFSVGMRIEHLSEDIDEAMYGSYAGSKALGRAEYSLSANTKTRGVYTFCMCPGGEVVPAASEEGGVVVNGMSYNARSGRNSNSAVVSSVFRSDYGNTAEAAIEFQRKIERAAYAAGGSDYSAPIITVGDFLSGECKTEPNRILPSYMYGSAVRLARPEMYLPGFVCENIKGALLDFDKKIRGFARADAVLTGAETRTSAPVRIIRNPETRLASGYENLFPAGEGAGYAGGITSAAVDGVRSALSLMKIYRP